MTMDCKARKKRGLAVCIGPSSLGQSLGDWHCSSWLIHIAASPLEAVGGAAPLLNPRSRTQIKFFMGSPSVLSRSRDQLLSRDTRMGSSNGVGAWLCYSNISSGAQRPHSSLLTRSLCSRSTYWIPRPQSIPLGIALWWVSHPSASSNSSWDRRRS